MSENSKPNQREDYQRGNDLLILVSKYGDEPNKPIITPKYLLTVVAPYLHALEEIQQIMDEVRHFSPKVISIYSITRNSPITVSVDGLSETINLIQNSVVKWRHRHQVVTAHLEEEKLRAEILEARSNSEKNRAEAENSRQDAKRKEFELEQDKILCALELLDKVSPELAETARLSYAAKLCPSLEIILNSELKIYMK
jgi:hypothetical protein